MKKEDFIAKYGEEKYKKRVEQIHEWQKARREEEKVRVQKWREENPDKVRAISREQCRKGGKRYEKKLEYERTGLESEKNKIRGRHAREYQHFKNIIAPDSQLHHEWIPKTSEYTGVALVDADAHMQGIIDVIEILEGEITRLTEEKKGKRNEQKQKRIHGTSETDI